MHKGQIIIGIIFFVLIFIYFKFIARLIDNYPTYFVSVFIGLIAYSIPFLWNAYQRILDKKDHTKGDKIENILTKEFYQKSLKYFEFFIQYPVGISIFLGLFVVPLLSFYFGTIVLVLSFFYFLLLPQIFQKIERSSTTDLKDFLENTKAESEDTKKAFAELWQKQDDFFEKEFSIESSHVFEYFAKKVDSLIEHDNTVSTLLLISDFNSFLKNRSNLILSRGTAPFLKILEWHLKVWKKKHEYLCKKDKQQTWFEYNRILDLLNLIFQFIEESSLKDRSAQGFSSYMFFDYLKKHANTYKEETVESSNNKTRFYREYLFGVFYSVFFKNSPYEYDIWDSFPNEWKIKKSNLEDKENLISEISLYKFLTWARERIQLGGNTRDKQLDNIIINLFPEVAPMTWSSILLFIYSDDIPDNRIKSTIERPWNFGWIGRTTAFWGKREDADAKIKEDIEKQEKDTFELVQSKWLWSKTFAKEKLEKYIEELKKSTSESKPEEEAHRIELLRIFEKMLNLTNSKK